ncbi:MAG TPA: hypothetical protein VK053_05770 [Jiangellaceae bacterium]|nr:hypothetical protein [Jiangellaceae bacterium]
MLSLRRRLWPILAVYFGAPVCAEYLYTYLTATGNPLELLALLLIFAPLYGGAALLIREIAVRTGRGWRGVLLLAAAFGVAMPGLIDLALLGEHRADIPYWEELRQPTLIQPLGLALHPTLGWIAGHVLMSVGAPLALLYALAPSQRARPLLGRAGLAIVVILAAIAAVLVHMDGQRTYGYVPQVAQVVGVSLVVLVLVAAAFSRWGRPLTTNRPVREVASATILLGGIVGKVAIDLVPNSWAGAVALVVILVAAFALIYWLARSFWWGPSEIGLLGAAAVIGGTLIGFLTPVAEGVSVASKYAQNTVLLLLAIGLTVLVYRATSADNAQPTPSWDSSRTW